MTGVHARQALKKMKSNHENQKSTYPNPMEARLERIITPFHEFTRNQTTGSILLILCTIIALGLANSPLADSYEHFVDMHVGFVLDEWSMTMSVRHWINDGLMSLFFFVLGLEIKREILVGELNDPQQSFPIIMAAIGGMLAPALIFYIFNTGTNAVHGWGIPMATDTAFAVGILALLGRRIPLALITFLTALAIIDDLGAIMVIGIFYTETISLPYLTTAGLFLFALAACNFAGFRHPLIYIIGGGIIWLAMLGSGVHASVAGILVALTVPARPIRNSDWFVRRTRKLINDFEDIGNESTNSILSDVEQHVVVERVQDSAEKASTPLRRWERALETPVALLVMPIFALANAGIAFNIDSLAALSTDPLALGIMLGLVAGKSIGITVFAWLALKLKFGRLSQGVNMNHILGIGLLGGMGFTMSIFIAGLGFANNPEALLAAKSAILLASLLAGVTGYLWLRLRR
jgi:Na+:H+ antiporter, NhaA family